MTLRVLGTSVLLLWSATAPAYAHHSFAMFDHDKTVTLTGTVKEFEWANPHTWLHMVSKDPSGKLYEWGLEMGSPGQNTQAGWKRDSVKPGDTVSVSFHPLKDGSHGGQLLTATLPSGQTVGQGGRPAE
jgi:hypothetical protein